MLRRILVLFPFLLITFALSAQNVGIGTSSPHPSAKMEISSTYSGLLVPRINIPNLNAASPVSNPAISLLVFNTNMATGQGFYYWDGSMWVRLQDQPSNDHDWYESGTITAPDNIADNMYTNGYIGVGTNNPQRSIHTTGSIFLVGEPLTDRAATQAILEFRRSYATYTTPGISDGAFRILHHESEFGPQRNGVVFELLDGNQQYGDGGMLFRAQGAAVGDSLDILSLLTSNGYVGIGTKFPVYNAHVHSHDNNGTRIFAEGNGLGYINAAVVLQSNSSTDYRGTGIYMNDVNGQNEWYAGRPYAGSDRFVIQRFAGSGAHNDVTAGVVDGSGNQTTTQRFFSVENNGNVGIAIGYGVPVPTERLDVNGNARFRAIGSGASAGALHYTANGTLSTSTSDIRFKTQIENQTSMIDKVMQLRSVRYHWKADSLKSEKDYGFIAQEVESLFPSIVFTNPTDGYKGINHDRFMSVLTKATQEQQQLILSQQKEITQLKTDKADKDAQLIEMQQNLDDLGQRLEQLEALIKEK